LGDSREKAVAFAGLSQARASNLSLLSACLSGERADLDQLAVELDARSDDRLGRETDVCAEPGGRAVAAGAASIAGDNSSRFLLSLTIRHEHYWSLSAG
jgi:hypothetical protein